MLGIRLKARTMRRELSEKILGLSLLTAIAFIAALIEYFDSGLENASKASVLMEARAFGAEYRKNPNTPLPESYSTHLFLDNWDKAPAFYHQIIPFDELEPGDFLDVEWSPNGIEEWEDSRFLVIYWHQLHDGRDLFVVSDFDANMLTPEEQAAFDDQFARIFYFSGAYLLLMLLVVWIYNRRINRYTQLLADWAEGLTLDNVAEVRPDFRYEELNRISEQLQLAFERIALLLERERQFLRHASHELRTPIAVIRANMELLDKMGVPDNLARPVDRIRRANHGMLQLTETLLWLSRENEAAPNVNPVHLPHLLDELSEELAYLLQDKEVSLQRIGFADIPAMALAETPLRIVVSNLLRNAFQYTAEGDVRIDLSPERLVIENREHGTQDIDTDQSFGLGLMLVKRICDRLGWTLTLEFLATGVRAELTLPRQD